MWRARRSDAAKSFLNCALYASFTNETSASAEYVRASLVTVVPPTFGVITAATDERISATFASDAACVANFSIFASSARASSTRESTFVVSSSVRSVRSSAATASRTASISALTASRRSRATSRYDFDIFLL